MPQTGDKSPAKPGSRNRKAGSNDTDIRGVEGDFLIDVTDMGDDVGLELPAAMTVAARAACAAWSRTGKHSE